MSTSGCLWRKAEEGWMAKGHESTVGAGNVLHLDFGGGNESNAL